jgi:hypothetical protein
VTVTELIEILKTMPQDLKVVISDDLAIATEIGVVKESEEEIGDGGPVEHVVVLKERLSSWSR